MDTILTNRQKQALNIVIAYTEEYGFPPTRQEIASQMSIKTPRGAFCHLVALQKKGFIKLYPVPRGIQVLKEIQDAKV